MHFEFIFLYSVREDSNFMHLYVNILECILKWSPYDSEHLAENHLCDTLHGAWHMGHLYQK